MNLRAHEMGHGAGAPPGLRQVHARRVSPAGLDWRAAALLGLISSSVSTLASQFAAARIGRDAMVDWTVVAAIPLRDGALQVEPGWPVILAGILFHQWADFSWAVVFFGLLGRWTADLRPGVILFLAAPWALLTSSAEWLFLVPVFPFWQPVFTLEQPYWIGFLVHLTSALAYPLFPWLRDRLADRPSPHARAAALGAGLGAAGLLGLGCLAFLGWQGRELPWAGADLAYDQGFIRRMSGHHAQGVALARLGAERAQDSRLRALARLMAAAQAGEIAVFDQWWRSWFRTPPEICSPAERAAMPGMLDPSELDGLARAAPDAFDGAFVRLMTTHHRGAIAMADEAMRRAGDPRLRLMAQAIRHGQRGEIDLMHGAAGLAASRAAVANFLLPLGQAPADRDRHRPSRPDG
ncbi:DUF305 domain-containing protein [Methylobacterium nodulans]|uniref:DUF305 domain-containing protein n=1 Tax=Methylobacterium nodulans (strain LMG 21967 / CNCM I-2342 / ORS 2060) TaxID=460265 RepID=B8IKI5_METNO|nr:DUF305 domain-containing protein [Methylobacterium nodulans]ACL56192.1 protein of unknown function DUF305 [Methylobacterium nodulans ORS 2060]